MLDQLHILAQAAKPIDPETRAQAMTSVMLVIVSAVFLLILVMAGAAVLRRRLRRHRSTPSKFAPDDDWYQKPLDEANDPP